MNNCQRVPEVPEVLVTVQPQSSFALWKNCSYSCTTHSTRESTFSDYFGKLKVKSRHLPVLEGKVLDNQTIAWGLGGWGGVFVLSRVSTFSLFI